jgi:hypothetical protein
MLYNTQNYWVSGLFPSAAILQTRKHDFSETICFRPQVRWEKTATQLVPLERANVNYWTTPVSRFLCYDPTVSRPFCLEIKYPSGAYNQIFITVRHLRFCWYRVLSLTRGRVCRLQLLLVLARKAILGSECRRTRDRILLSQIWDFPFCRLLRLSGLRWRYSTPPALFSVSEKPHGLWGGSR